MAGRPVVTWKQLSQAHGDAGFEAVEAQVSEQAKAEGGDEVEAAARIMSLNRALREIREVDSGNGVLTTPRDPIAAALQSYIADASLKAGKNVPLMPGGEEAIFDQNDWAGWAASFFTWWRKLVPHAWVPPPTAPTLVDDKLRIGMLADWGTGLYGAPVCAQSMDGDADGYDISLHLGDVYYSGTEREERDEFLKYWPHKARKFSLALNSNHEMYTGAQGLFKVTLAAFGQRSTCFWLENANFVLVGLDTAYAEHDLANDQAQWLQGIVNGARGKRVILFSHHQPFSQLDNQGPNLVAKLGALLAGQKIFAWYWGHEHRLAVYDRHPGWGMLGRCLGHGGMPYFRDKEPGMGGNQCVLCPVNKVPGVPPGLVLDGPNPYVEGHEQEYGPNGYVSLEFDGPKLVERFHLPDSTKLLSHELKPDGTVSRIIS